MKIFFCFLLTFIFTTAGIISGFAQDSIKTLFPNDTLKIGRFQIVKINGVEQKDWETVLRNADYNSISIKYLKMT